MRLLPLVQRRRVRALLGYDPATAGGLMSPEFVCVFSQATQSEVLDADPRYADVARGARVGVRHEREPAARRARSRSSTSSGPTRTRASATSPTCRSASGADADLEEVARLMTDYDLTVVPVVDAEERMLGVVTVDDVLELVLPRGWRRQFGLFGE